MLELIELAAGATLFAIATLWFVLSILTDLFRLLMPCIGVLGTFLLGLVAVSLSWYRDGEHSTKSRPFVVTGVALLGILALLGGFCSLTMELSALLAPPGPAASWTIRLEMLAFNHTGRSLEQLTSETQGMGEQAYIYLFERVSAVYYQKWSSPPVTLLQFRWLLGSVIVVADSLVVLLLSGGVPLASRMRSQKKRRS